MNISEAIINVDEVYVRVNNEVIKFRSKGSGGGDRV